MPSTAKSPTNLEEICGALRDQAQQTDGDALSVQVIFEAFSGRIFGPLLLIPATVVLIPPLGAIPTVPTMMGVLTILIAGQKLMGRSHPWIPQFILKREISKERFETGLNWFEPWAKRIDWFIRPRLKFLVTGGMKYFIAALCVLLAAMLPPLDVVPFVAAIPGFGLFCLGLAITAEDGVLGLLGILAAVAAAGFVIWWTCFA